jgi:hypothetical protein
MYVRWYLAYTYHLLEVWEGVQWTDQMFQADQSK